MFVELFVAILALLYVWMFVHKSKSQKLYSQFPGPKAFPIIGNMLEFDNSKEEITTTLKKLSFKYGPVFHLTLGGEHLVCLRDPSLIEIINTNSNALLDKPPIYDIFKPILEDGLFSCKAEKWKKQRKLLNPAFHMQVLDNYIPTFEIYSGVLTDNLLNNEGKDVDVTKLVTQWADDILWETVMGVKVNAQQPKSRERNTIQHEQLHELSDIIVHRNFSLIQRSFLFHFLPIGRRHNTIIKQVNGIIDKEIKERKIAYSNKKEAEIDGSLEELGIKKRKTFLDLLLEYNQAGAGMSDEQVRAEVKTFVIGGVDTTSSAAAFTLYCLSQHPDVQERVYLEVLDVVGFPGEVTIQQLQAMKYCERVIKEAQRLYPAAQLVARRNNTDLDLKNGYIIPKDSTVMLLTEAMGHDPNIFPDPFRFDPDRFEGGKVHPYSHLPFNIAPRNCIGQKFAILGIKCLISRILQKVELLPSDIPLNLRFSTVLTSSTGVNIRVRARNLLSS